MPVRVNELKLALEDFAHEYKVDPKGLEKSFALALQRVFQAKYKYHVPKPTIEPEVDFSKGIVRVVLKFPSSEGEEVKVIKPENFTHMDVQKLREEFRNIVRHDILKSKLSKIQAYINKIITGRIQKVDKKSGVLVGIQDLKVEGRIEPSGMVKDESYKPGKDIEAVVLGIDEKSSYPLILSRSDPRFVQALLERAIPEIQDGTVQIVSIAREAGVMSKIAVKSRDPFVSPVSTLLGPKGTRLNTIKSKLPHNEIIDIIPYDSDLVRFAILTLQPAKGAVAAYDTGEEIFVFYEDDEEILRAKGREGLNAKLASRLVGKKVNVKGISEFEPPSKGVTLYELKDKLPPEVYERLKENAMVYFTKIMPLAYIQRILGTDEATTIRILEMIEDAIKEKEGANA